MIKLYFKQAFFQLRENRLISLVSIIGTALAICMIMVIVLVLEVRITDCVPEVNRSRSLYMKAMSIHQKGDTSDNSSNGCMSLTVAKECFKALTVPETVTIGRIICLLIDRLKLLRRIRLTSFVETLLSI